MNQPILRMAAAGLTFLLAEVVSLLAAGLEPQQVEEIAAMLPARPMGLGEPMTNRSAWTQLAGQPAFQELLREARATAQQPLPESPDELYLDYSKTGNRERWQKVARLRRGRVPTFALAEGLENHGRFLAPLEEVIRALCAERTWVMPAHDGRLDNFHGRAVEMDLGATMLAWDLATADYLLGEKLSAPTRQLLRDNLARRIFRPFREMVEGRRKEIYWLAATHNWNAVCLAGITGSALASVEAPGDRAFFVAAARHYIKNFLRGFTPDGYCSEGLGYWNYGFGYFVMLAEVVRQATGGKVDLLAEPAARGPAFFGLRSEIVNGVYPSIADCTPGTQPDPPSMNYLARRFAMPGLAAGLTAPSAVPRSLYGAALFKFLPAQLPVISAPDAQAESPLRSWFQDGGVLICRPAPNGPAFGVALKGGHNAEHHNHNDVGTFMVVAGGTMVLCDPGSEVYTARTFSARRYDSDVLNSFGHPVPVVAGQLQREGRQARGKVLRAEFSQERDTLELDVSSAYAVPALKRLERAFIYQRQPAASLTVADRVEFQTPQSFETALITWGPWHRVSERELLITNEGGGARVRIDAGGEPFTLTSKLLEADVHTPRHAERIAITLSSPVKSALVSVVITPASGEQKQK